MDFMDGAQKMETFLVLLDVLSWGQLVRWECGKDHLKEYSRSKSMLRSLEFEKLYCAEGVAVMLL